VNRTLVKNVLDENMRTFKKEKSTYSPSFFAVCFFFECGKAI